jgi:hypothetical protein
LQRKKERNNQFPRFSIWFPRGEGGTTKDHLALFESEILLKLCYSESNKGHVRKRVKGNRWNFREHNLWRTF